MKILATNDDGIYADGLWALVRALKGVGQVVVVAPDREKSGIGTAVTLHRSIRVHKVLPLVEGIETYAVEGTPSDCIILALGSLAREGVELVVSGINMGANLGDDVFVSGTVGAAFQGYFRGLPALAVSVAVSSLEMCYDVAALLATRLAEKLIAGVISRDTLLNVNLPNLPLEMITGVEITRVAQQRHLNLVEERQEGRGRKHHWIMRGRSEGPLKEGTDIWAILQDRVSITPLHDDLTSHGRLNPLQSLRSTLLQDLQLGS